RPAPDRGRDRFAEDPRLQMPGDGQRRGHGVRRGGASLRPGGPPMTAVIHPTAVIAENAVLHEGVQIGPYAVVGDDVVLGARTRVGAHALIHGPAVFGEDNRIYPHAALGSDPQDLKYRGETTRLTVGSRNVFREFTTVHRGTANGLGETVIGDDNYLMNYTHVAHDNRIGSK